MRSRPMRQTCLFRWIRWTIAALLLLLVAMPIADRSYHRLLHLDWIRADVDGDGLREYVPRDDQTGPNPPERSYLLFATGRPAPEPRTARRFYFGGNVYEGWSAVPALHKAPPARRPEPDQNVFRIFTLTW